MRLAEPIFAFTIPGPPRGEARHRTAVKNGKPRNYRPKEAAAYRSHIQACALEAIGSPLLEGPVACIIRAFSEWPRSSWRKRKPRRTEPHVSKPDADNVAKAILDALNGIAWIDDAQVSCLVVHKLRASQGDSARVEVEFAAASTA